MDRGTLQMVGMIALMGILLAVAVRAGTNSWMGRMEQLHEDVTSGKVDPREQMEQLQKQYEEANAEAERRAAEAAKPPSMVPWVLLIVAGVGLVAAGPTLIRRIEQSGPPRQSRVSNLPVTQVDQAHQEEPESPG